MLQAACVLIKRFRPKARVQVFTTAPDRLLQLCPGVEAVAPSGQAAWQAAKYFPIPRRILPLAMREWVFRKEKDCKYANPTRALPVMLNRADFQAHHAASVKPWIAAIESADAVIVTGGGFFTDAFGAHLEGLLHTLSWAREKKRMTAFFGQGLGPLNDPRLRKLAGVALRGADWVTLRENIMGPALGKELKCDTKAWKTTGDDAFALLASEPTEMTDGQLIGINLRVAAYSNVDSSIRQRITDALAAVQSRFKNAWMPLPVDLSRESGDEIQVKRCISAAGISADYQKPDTPKDLWALVQHCRLVITGSYHAAVFALSAGVPVIGLAANAYYQTKFAGLQAFFPDGVRIVDSHVEDITSELKLGVEWGWQLPFSRRSEINEQAQLIAANVEKAYSDFFNRLDR